MHICIARFSYSLQNAYISHGTNDVNNWAIQRMNSLAMKYRGNTVRLAIYTKSEGTVYRIPEGQTRENIIA